jgi:transposase
MSMNAHEVEPIPADTARIAHQAFPKGSEVMHLRDAFGPLYHDEHFARLFPKRGRGAYAPWRLALISVLQVMEGLTDRQAAQMVRGRLDWKYALSLPLEDAGFDHSILSDFRSRLLEQKAESLLLDPILSLARSRGWLVAGGKQRTDATHVLAAVRNLNRLESVGESMRAALNELAEQDGDWLEAHMDPDWFERYVHRFELSRFPKGEREREELRQQVGTDVLRLLSALAQPQTPQGLRQAEKVVVLSQVFAQQYEVREGQAHWRAGPACHHEDGLISPYDPDARFSRKRETLWLGYKVHLSETCDQREDAPHLIIHVQTTAATAHDSTHLAPILQTIREQGDAAGEHYVDAGYPSGQQLVEQAALGTQLIGPVGVSTSWQERLADGLGADAFRIDWQQRQAICPAGKTSRRWSEKEDRGGQPMVVIQFAANLCAVCPLRAQCTTSTRGRSVQLTPQAARQQLQQRREEQQSQEFQTRYALRAGVEGTIAQAVSRGMRQSRYRGLGKTHLGHVALAAGCNLLRMQDFEQRREAGKTARVSRPLSPFAALRAQVGA